MPGGFHPFHPGHLSLYNSARRTFPDADVYVAATNDTSTRPFPFPIKEKLAYLAGTSKEDAIEPGHFIQVKSPFRADEITSQFDPNKDQLIFVRSVKDANKPPQAGGVLKTGKPAYLQPLLTAKKLEPFSKHAYMAYLPVEPFGGDKDMEGATQIRELWPTLDSESKLDFVNSLYPRTTNNRKLAATVAKMLDTAIGTSVDEDVSRRGFLRGLGAAAVAGATSGAMAQSGLRDASAELMSMTRDDPRIQHNKDVNELAKAIYERMVVERGQPMDRRQQRQWLEIARIKAEAKFAQYAPGKPSTTKPSADFPSQPSERRRARDFDNFEESHTVGYIQEEDPDYIEEKWSKKYKRSIDCSHPRGFSQRAHCAGRKK